MKKWIMNVGHWLLAVCLASLPLWVFVPPVDYSPSGNAIGTFLRTVTLSLQALYVMAIFGGEEFRRDMRFFFKRLLTPLLTWGLFGAIAIAVALYFPLCGTPSGVVFAVVITVFLLLIRRLLSRAGKA